LGVGVEVEVLKGQDKEAGRGNQSAHTATTWQIDYELRGHEPRDRAADLLLEIEDGLERGAEVFDAADEVACVYVVLCGVSLVEELVRREEG